MRLAEEQSVVGLVAAGLEHVSDVKVPQQWALHYHFSVFPLDSLKVWGRMVTRGLLAVLQAEKHE